MCIFEAMETFELLNIRLYNQLLSAHTLKEPHEVVSRMGAMQSQAFDMAKWAVGSRLENKRVGEVEEALNKGKIIRTHILRPTWHFVSAEDIHWMFALSYPRLKPIYRAYMKSLGVDESLIHRVIPLIEETLIGGKHLIRREINDALRTWNIIVDDNTLKWILSYAEMEGVVVSGCMKGNKQSFTLLEEWIPRKQSLSKEEALERLSRKYFTSHGPATVQDFAWWSGLTVTDCRKAVHLIKDDFICETVNGREFWMRNDIHTPPAGNDSALLLAPFDEFVVSYKNRSEIIEENYYSKVMMKNGLFSPTVILNGKIIGSWKKTTGKNKPRIELSFFEKTSKQKQELFKPAIKQLEIFYAKTGNTEEMPDEVYGQKYTCVPEVNLK